MNNNFWEGKLGNNIREPLMESYEGLPFDEPKYDLYYLQPSIFKGFARSSRNIIVFNKDTVGQGFRLIKNLWARPQVTALITGEDEDVMNFYFDENKDLLLRSISENIIAYTLPINIDLQKIEERIPAIRDSIGRIYVPGRVPGSYMITERAYLPYYYKTKVNNLDAILTKGTWEVQNDFMAGPYVNYIIKDTVNERNIVIEGFSFAPSESKRDYMFELNTIITTMEFVK